tara:strand:- start:238 stop:417 length:180 start_codon:yes stop_codon:yes gene_type:complete
MFKLRKASLTFTSAEASSLFAGAVSAAGSSYLSAAYPFSSKVGMISLSLIGDSDLSSIF